MTTALLRKLTDLGAIGHVRLGAGEQRVRIGYTEKQIAEFIHARTVPPTPLAAVVASAGARAGRRGRRRGTNGPADVSEAAAGLVQTAIATGRVTEWRHP